MFDSSGNEVTLSTHIGNLNPFRYRSYYFDTETKLYYLKTRYYDPEVGRFINIDSIDYADPQTINGLNLYAYCGNNPVMNIDSDGHAWWKAILVAAVAVCAVAAIAAVTVATGGSALPVLVGAGIGLVSNGAVSVGTQLATAGSVDWQQVVVDASVGAVTGALGGSALGKVEMAIASGITEFAGSGASDWVADESINWVKAGIAGGIGFIGGLASGGGAQNGKLHARRDALKTRKEIKRRGAQGYSRTSNYTFGLNSNKGRLDRATKALNKTAIKEIVLDIANSLEISVYQTLALIKM